MGDSIAADMGHPTWRELPLMTSDWRTIRVVVSSTLSDLVAAGAAPR
jgi:hypothetical protein